MQGTFKRLPKKVVAIEVDNLVPIWAFRCSIIAILARKFSVKILGPGAQQGKALLARWA